MSSLIYRTLLQLDQRRHEVSPNMLLCSVDEDCNIQVLEGLSVDKTVREEQLKAFQLPPLGFVMRGKNLHVAEGSCLYSNGDLGGITIETTTYTLPPYEVFEFSDYAATGVYIHQKPKDPNMSLTIGCCIHVNRIFQEYGAEIPFPHHIKLV